MFKITVHKKLKSPLTINKNKLLTPCVFIIQDEEKDKTVKYLTEKRGLKKGEYEVAESDYKIPIITDEDMINSFKAQKR